MTGFVQTVKFSAGLGLGLLVPCIFAMSAGLVPEDGAGALSFVSLLTGFPRASAPVVFGFIAGHYGTGLAFGLVAIALLVALVLVVLLRPRLRC